MQDNDFAPSSRRALQTASSAAASLGHDYVGTEHILLGIMADRQSNAVAILRAKGIDPDSVELQIRETIKRGQAGATGPDLPYTSRGKKVLQMALDAARADDDAAVDTPHLLFALLREEKGIAAQTLAAFGLTLARWSP